MAVTLVPAHSGKLESGGLSSSWTGLGPGSGVTPGQIVVVGIVTEGVHTIASVTAGWTQIATTVNPGVNPGGMSIFARRFVSGDTGLVDISFTIPLRATVAWCVLDGVDGSTMLDADAVIGTTGYGSAKDLSITTVNAGSGLLMFNASDPTSTIAMSWDAGITPVIEANQSGTGHIDVGFVAQATPGTTSMGGDWAPSRGGAHMLIAFRAGSYTPPTIPGWVRASDLLRPEEDTAAGIISTSTKTGSSIGVSAVISALPVSAPSSLWLVDSNTGPANGYELVFDATSMTLRSVVDGEATHLVTGATTIASSDEVSLVIVDGVVAGMVDSDEVVYSAQSAQTGPWYAGLEGADDALLISAVNFGTYSGSAPTEPEVPPEPDPPAAASGLAVWEDSAGVISAQFSLPTAPATGYVIRYKSGLAQTFSGSVDGSDFYSGTGSPSEAIAVSIPGFTPGQSYTLAVWVVDSATGLFSSVVTDDLTLAAYPQPPSGVTLTANGSALTATFLMPAQNVTGYTVRYKAGASQTFSGPTDGTAFDDSSASPSDSIQSTSGLTFQDGPYTVAVWTYNDSIYSQTYVSGNVTVSTISDVSSGSIDQTTATIAWTTSPASLGYVEYGTTQALGESAASTAGVSTVHQVVLLGLIPNTTYYYRIKAVT